MNQTEARAKLIEILGSMGKQCEYVPNADIFKEYGLDSLDQIEFLYNVEERFGVKIEEEAFEELGLRKFDALVDYLIQQAA